VTIPWDSGDLLPRLALILSRGGIAIAPCDTMYGIIGIVPDSESRIRTVKERGEDKPFLQLISDVTWVRRVAGAEPPPALARHWPGPLTLIIPVVSAGPFTRNLRTVAVRVPDSAWLRDLIQRLDAPLYSTSVNRAGQDPLWKISEIRAAFECDVDLIVDGGNLGRNVPSTIVDASSRPFKVVRHGVLEMPDEDLA
jgi:L-threonylcarbamoyladenylate synthase